jgi:thiamine-phosphate pyrophosphorylase
VAISINPTVLRLLDANANRAREALRVLEDYARFVLDDRELIADLKQLRHEMAHVLRSLLSEAILHRDTPGDVGTENKTAGELHRQDLTDVVTAAGKRAGEALRAIEEYLKTITPADAAQIEHLRYRFYDIEQRIAKTLCVTKRFADVRLYVLITEKLCRRPWLDAAEAALLGGADCLQLREKDLEPREVLHRAKQLVELCRRYHRLCIINDRPDIAILSNADGVHVGQDDLPASQVRKLIGRERILGVSTHNLDQSKRAQLDGADYIGVGPIFSSSTKPREFVAGLDYARQVASEIPIPAVAIAGITGANVDEVLAAGVRAIAVTAAVLDCEDPKKAAAELKAGFARRMVGQTFLSASEQQVGQTFLSASDRRSEPDPDPVPTTPDPALKISHRKLPHWKLEGSTYFVTFRLASRELNAPERQIVLDHVKSGSDRFYTLIAATIMPDHTHLLLTPLPQTDLSRILKSIKGVSARFLNQFRQSGGKVWQDESWDRIVRNQNELDEKLEYMLNNSVKKQLVADPWTYDGWYYNETWKEQMADKNVCPTNQRMSAPPVRNGTNQEQRRQAGMPAPPELKSMADRNVCPPSQETDVPTGNSHPT